jgi:hypothetical protein
MDLTRPVVGWKNLLDPMTWQGITGILPLLFPTIEGVPKTKLVNRVTKKGGRIGAFMFLAAGPTGDTDWLMSDAGVTVTTDIAYTGTDPEAAIMDAASGYKVPEGKLWIFPRLSVGHNDNAVARASRLKAAGLGGALKTILASTNATLALYSSLCLTEPVLLRSGWTLGVDNDGMTAGKQSFIEGMCIEINEDEPCPFF